jgi:hypothetical protein
MTTRETNSFPCALPRWRLRATFAAAAGHAVGRDSSFRHPPANSFAANSVPATPSLAHLLSANFYPAGSSVYLSADRAPVCCSAA